MSAFRRRDVLRSASRLGLLASFGGTLPFVYQSVLGADDRDEDYRALVCVLLAGGADSFNLLVPRSESAYSMYKARRGDLSLDLNHLLPISAEQGTTTFGLHPSLTGLQGLFERQHGAWLTNIGPLVEPTSPDAFNAGQVDLPLGLFSHADQISSWQTVDPGTRTTTGFGGRLGDQLIKQNLQQPLATSITLSGSNVFQSGRSSGSYSMNAGEGVRTIGGFDDSDVFRSALTRLIAEDRGNVLRRAYAEKLDSAISTGAVFREALSQAQTLNTEFAADPFSSAMAQIARVMSIRQLLGARRQTFFVTYGGWDHHEDTLGQMENMLPALDQGLSQFFAAMEELGMSHQVTTFTISDFGRTLTSNGKGSDHGWGGQAWVMGGAVNGGQIFGQYPDLDADNPLDVGRGRFLPTTSVDALYAEFSRWMGVEPLDHPSLLPNYAKFVGESQGIGLEALLSG